MAAMLVVNGFMGWAADFLLHHLLPFLFFSLPVKLTEFNFFLAFFQGVSLDTPSRRRKKTFYTKEHLAMLEDPFWENHFPSWKERSQIIQKLKAGEDCIMA